MSMLAYSFPDGAHHGLDSHNTECMNLIDISKKNHVPSSFRFRLHVYALRIRSSSMLQLYSLMAIGQEVRRATIR